MSLNLEPSSVEWIITPTLKCCVITGDNVGKRPKHNHWYITDMY